MARRKDPKISPLWMVGLLGAFALVMILRTVFPHVGYRAVRDGEWHARGNIAIVPCDDPEIARLFSEHRPTFPNGFACEPPTRGFFVLVDEFDPSSGKADGVVEVLFVFWPSDPTASIPERTLFSDASASCGAAPNVGKNGPCSSLTILSADQSTEWHLDAGNTEPSSSHVPVGTKRLEWHGRLKSYPLPPGAAFLGRVMRP